MELLPMAFAAIYTCSVAIAFLSLNALPCSSTPIVLYHTPRYTVIASSSTSLLPSGVLREDREAGIRRASAPNSVEVWGGGEGRSGDILHCFRCIESHLYLASHSFNCLSPPRFALPPVKCNLLMAVRKDAGKRVECFIDGLDGRDRVQCYRPVVMGSGRASCESFLTCCLERGMNATEAAGVCQDAVRAGMEEIGVANAGVRVVVLEDGRVREVRAERVGATAQDDQENVGTDGDTDEAGIDMDMETFTGAEFVIRHGNDVPIQKPSDIFL